jgi:hypothetical protein
VCSVRSRVSIWLYFSTAALISVPCIEYRWSSAANGAINPFLIGYGPTCSRRRLTAHRAECMVGAIPGAG